MLGVPKATEGAVIDGVVYDKKDQYDQIVPWILAGERLYTVLDCKGGGTGFIAVTQSQASPSTSSPKSRPRSSSTIVVSSVVAGPPGRRHFGQTVMP